MGAAQPSQVEREQRHDAWGFQSLSQAVSELILCTVKSAERLDAARNNSASCRRMQDSSAFSGTGVHAHPLRPSSPLLECHEGFPKCHARDPVRFPGSGAGTVDIDIDSLPPRAEATLNHSHHPCFLAKDRESSPRQSVSEQYFARLATGTPPRQTGRSPRPESRRSAPRNPKHFLDPGATYSLNESSFTRIRSQR